jgi:hypothetical protein
MLGFMILYMIVVTVLIVGSFAIRDHLKAKSVVCCKTPEAVLWNHVNMAQNNRPSKSLSRALCLQAHGSVIEVDGLFVGCVGGE